MDFIYNTWWLWLALSAAALAFPGRTPARRTARDLILAVTGITFMISVVLHFFPAI